MRTINKNVVILTLLSLILTCFQTVVAQSANAADVTVNYLLVGAGGNGGTVNGGGGGGAGGVASGNISLQRDLTNYTVSVGAPNLGWNIENDVIGDATNRINQGFDGQPSTISGGSLATVSAFGGGGGGSYGYSNGRNGGSGGGGGPGCSTGYLEA